MSTTESADTLEPTSTRPRYDEYEDSGVEWLGEIPAEWDVVRLKFLTDFTGGGTPSKDNREYWGGDIPWVSPKDMKAGRVTETQDQITPEAVEESSTRLVEPGSVLIVVRSGILKHTIPVATNEVEVALNQDLKAVTPNQRLHSRYLAYLVEGRNDTLLLKWTKSGTTVESLEQERISNTEVPVPSFDEQRAIAKFLDRETERIDALIEKKEQLIDLLEEKRTALISRVVTKGLDGDVEMQDSGVEWLGEIPAHWETIRLKHLAIAPGDGIQMGPYGSMLKGLESRDTGYKVYGQENIISGDFEVGHRWVSEERFYEMADRYELRPGDLVLTRKGSIGNSRVVPKEIQSGIMDSDTIRVRLRWEKIERHFLQLLLHQAWYMQTQIALVQRGAVLSGLNTNTIENLMVALPPMDEQEQLVKYLDNQAGKLDGKISTMREGIDRLKEYRTALISAAVTGQVDVRSKVGVEVS